MAETTDRFALPLLQAGQAQKEVTHNESIARIDALLHLAVASRGLNEPPTAPEIGSAWIVGAAPTGIWAGNVGRIAAFDDGGWSFIAPRDGCLAFVGDEGVFAVFAGGAWRGDAWPVRALDVDGRRMLGAEPAAFPTIGGGSVVDAEARIAIAELANVLRAMGIVRGD